MFGTNPWTVGTTEWGSQPGLLNCPIQEKRASHFPSNDKLNLSWPFYQSLVFGKLCVGWKTSRGAASVDRSWRGWKALGCDAVPGRVLYSDVADFTLLLEYGRSLEDDICSDTSLMFQRVLVSLSAVSRSLLLRGRVGCYWDTYSLPTFPAFLIFSPSQMGIFPCVFLGSLLFYPLSFKDSG